MKISVIIVTYNAAKTLQNCLDSIYCQDFKDIEIIVIDGQSTDGTVEILKNNDSSIAYWKSEPDRGIYDAMNKAINYANGLWVYFLGADDELRPEFSGMAVGLEDVNAIYYGNVFAEGAKRLGELTRYQFAKFGPYHQAIIYPKAVFDKHKYDLHYNISADFALNIELCGDRTFHFVYCDYIVANFNHAGISGAKIDERFQKDKARLILNNFGLPTWLRYKIHKYKNRRNPRA